MLANTLVPVETSFKVVAGPPASDDLQVTLSHVECLPQALALDPPGVALRGSHRASTVSITKLFSGAPHKLLAGFDEDHHQAV